MVNQLSRISFAPRARFAPNVHEIIRIIVAFFHDFGLGVMQERQELAVEAILTFFGQPEVEPPHATAEDRPPIIHVLSRRHPSPISAQFLYIIDLGKPYQRATAS